MNRIVLVGNGFDLSCNLPTKYEQFLIWYIASIFSDFDSWQEDRYEDPLVKVNYAGFLPEVSKEILRYKSLDDLRDDKTILIDGFTSEKGEKRAYEKARFSFRSNFFKELIQQKKWSDIEGEYFKFLYRIKSREYDKTNPFKHDVPIEKEVENLNFQFEFIKERLTNYITFINQGINDEDIILKRQFFDKCYKQPQVSIQQDFFIDPKPRHAFRTSMDQNISKKMNALTFINFNYTKNLLRQLFVYENDEKQPFSVDHYFVHGYVSDTYTETDLSNEDERGIIFGYGDDTAKRYNELEQDGNGEYLKHMKSIYYSYDNIYRMIMTAIEDDKFELFLAGHSLGLSDRVLLKSIVEHKNCKMIRVFHKGTYESYRGLIGSLTRHFDDKIKMRRKFLEYDANDTIN